MKATTSEVTVRIPTSLNAKQVKEQVSALMTKQRGTKRIGVKSPLGFVGDVNYKRLKQYERYLEIEFDPKNAGKTVEEKTEALRGEYRRIKDRLDKQRKTLRDSGKARVAAKLHPRDPDAFDSESKIRKGIDAKKVSRWRLSGKLLLLNVASGEFPGRDYYGSKLAEKLKSRLKNVGLTTLETVPPNKGGGRTRESLRLQKIPSKTEMKAREALSDTALRGQAGRVRPRRLIRSKDRDPCPSLRVSPPSSRSRTRRSQEESSPKGSSSGRWRMGASRTGGVGACRQARTAGEPFQSRFETRRYLGIGGAVPLPVMTLSTIQRPRPNRH